MQNNTDSQPISTKHLYSNRSKPFAKAIIEEVTKEHFFTRESAMHRNGRNSADMSEASFTTGNGAGPTARRKQKKKFGGRS